MACSPCIVFRSKALTASTFNVFSLYFFFFSQANHALNEFLLLHITSTLPHVNSAAHIYKPETWRVWKERHWWQLPPRLLHLTLESGEGQNTAYTIVICNVYSHPCFLAYSAAFVCIFLTLWPHTHTLISLSMPLETISFLLKLLRVRYSK